MGAAADISHTIELLEGRPMRVVITGGGGFLGQMLGRAVLSRGVLASHGARGTVERQLAVEELVLVDVVRPATLLCDELAQKAQFVQGDLSDPALSKQLLSGADGGLSVFHLGAVMSGQGEADFDLAMRVNLHGTMSLLEAARNSGAPRPRFVMASAGATLGAGAPTDFVSKDDTVSDATRATPHTTYGMTKACAELLLSDYSRRGFLDGRGVRLPTVVVRAGAPNGATTGAFSAVVREALAGREAVLPIGRDVSHAVTSHRTAVESLLRMHELPVQEIDRVLGYDRTVFVPSIALSLGELETVTREVIHPACRDKLGKIRFEEDAALSAAVGSFPKSVNASRALELGLPQDPDAASIVRAYVEDFPSAVAPGIEILPPPTAATNGDSRTVAVERSVVVVTGGGTGIGKAVAQRLARGGWHRDGTRISIVLTGRRRQPLEETASEILKEHGVDVDVLACPADLVKPDEVERLFAAVRREYGRVDVLFNNAGAAMPPTPVHEMTYDAWRRVVGVNLDAAFHVAKEAFVLMKEQVPQGGRIINNGSISADRPRPGSIAYTASKHAVTGLTKSISLDGRPYSIACGQVDYGNVVSAISAGMAVGMPQADGSVRPEPRMSQSDAADAVHYMAALPLSANVLQMTVMATNMPFIGRG